jgi:uncharacterized membrane protein YqjE
MEDFKVRQMTASLREVTSSMTEVVKAEIQLARAEVKDGIGKVGRQGLEVGVFLGLAALGVLPFLAFLVVGLGILLNQNYWLSSLIVSLFFFAVGGGMAYRGYRRMKDEDLSLPETRQTLEEEREILQRKVHELSEATAKRRSA